MAYTSNYRSSELTGVNPVTITNEAQVVVDLSYKSAGARGVLLSEAALKESPSTIVMTVGGTTFNEVDISAFTGAANTFAVEYASNSGVIFLPPGTGLGTATTTTYKGLGTVATVESKKYNLDGTVGAPGISFANDPDSGRYRIGANRIGESIGGIKVSEINSLGLINGTAGTEFRNVLQVVQGQTTMTYSLQWAQVANTNYWLLHEGTYTPKSSSSKLLITGNMTSHVVSTSSSNNNLSLYYDTTSYGTVRSTNQAGIPGGTKIDDILGASSTAGTYGPFANAPIISIVTGLVAGTTYYISLWAKNSTAQATQYNRDATRSQLIFTELL